MSDWAIESVTIDPLPPIASTPEYPMPAPGTLMAIATGRTKDGRVFQYRTWVMQELLDDYGEERVKEMIRAEARPPSEE